jgi:hypothetical protein
VSLFGSHQIEIYWDRRPFFLSLSSFGFEAPFPSLLLLYLVILVLESFFHGFSFLFYIYIYIQWVEHGGMDGLLLSC